MIYPIIDIASAQNKIFKKYKSLTLKKFREKEALFLLEGQRYIDSALKIDVGFEALIFDAITWNDELSELERDSYNRKAPIYIFAGPLFKELTQTEQSQGIMGVLSIPESDLLENHLNRFASQSSHDIIMLDRIQDPGNLGTIIRTADAAGFETILLVKGTVDPYNAKVVRSSAGSLLNIKLIEVENSFETMEVLKKFGYRIVVTALENAKDYNDASNYGAKNCLVIGNEANGVSEMIFSVSDARVIIPIVGHAESLNASVAAGIMMYRLHARR